MIIYSEIFFQPNHNCSVWKTSTQSEGLKRETEKFRNSNLMKSLIYSVSKRLGFRYNLTYRKLCIMQFSSINTF